ncbi:alpha/beta fold hydrolase [Pseudodesulfovibrio thermohalotolerans]|uniref:alpha/beta hydrolase n=1 Tax=Pseudodesulfovibrio thermohalotolerans TaxID=2880651 RepID=UPI002442762A|nr:alpha/beta fold hydrolase [Pseudodesulfovibrio thermohalotolerans]WFS61933.1 alpha/beta fold hydrolase [Pseudodesulfovibrio thermohalotolerans]
MRDFRLLWCHGSLSRPWGTKSMALAETALKMGLSMEGPDFSDLDDPDSRVARLTSILAEDDRPAILAGSSMGGYVAAAASMTADVTGLFLLAPAFYLPGYAVHVFSNLPGPATVIHGWNDDVVPVDNAIRFARTHKAALHVLADGHRLENSTAELCALFARFLASATAPDAPGRP